MLFPAAFSPRLPRPVAGRLAAACRAAVVVMLTVELIVALPLAVLAAGVRASPTDVLPFAPVAARVLPAAAIGTVTARVYGCPAGVSRAQAAQAAEPGTVLAACAPLADEPATIRLKNAAGGPAEDPTEAEPGVFRWEGLPFATYLLAEGQPPAGFGDRLVTDEQGRPLADQRTVSVTVAGGAQRPERRFYHFVDAVTAAGTVLAGPVWPEAVR